MGGKGFGGGFAGKCASEFGEREIKDFVGHTKRIADRVARGAEERRRRPARRAQPLLAGEGHPARASPRRSTRSSGSYLLAEAVDAAGADLIVHGHAHAGVEKGLTPGGIRVRNVALPVLKRAYAVYHLHEEDHEEDAEGAPERERESAAAS